MLSISIIFVDEDSNGEICDGCKEEIKGKKWVMMLDFGDPQTSVPLETVYCTICKITFEKEDDI